MAMTSNIYKFIIVDSGGFGFVVLKKVVSRRLLISQRDSLHDKWINESVCASIFTKEGPN